MYTLNLNTGQVIRDEDGMIVAPTSSANETNFLQYKTWVNNGNTPTILDIQSQKNIITAWEFRDSFTQDELIQIINAAYDGNVQCRLLLLQIQTATDGVDLNGQSVIDGLTYLNNIGILPNGRINEIRRL